KIYHQRYQRGVPDADLEVIGETEETGTKITFKPDPEIFTETTEFDFNILQNRLRELAFLNGGVKIILKDLRGEEEKEVVFQFEGGIRSFVEHLDRNREVLNQPP